MNEFLGYTIIYLVSPVTWSAVVSAGGIQGCRVNWGPTGQQNGPTNGGVVSTSLSIKLLSLMFPLRYLDYSQKGGCEEQTPRCSLTGQAWLELVNEPVNAVMPGLGTSLC